METYDGSNSYMLPRQLPCANFDAQEHFGINSKIFLFKEELVFGEIVKYVCMCSLLEREDRKTQSLCSCEWVSIWGTEMVCADTLCKLYFSLGSIRFAFSVVAFFTVGTCRKEQRLTSVAWVLIANWAEQL